MKFTILAFSSQVSLTKHHLVLQLGTTYLMIKLSILEKRQLMIIYFSVDPSTLQPQNRVFQDQFSQLMELIWFTNQFSQKNLEAQ